MNHNSILYWNLRHQYYNIIPTLLIYKLHKFLMFLFIVSCNYLLNVLYNFIGIRLRRD